MKQMNLGVIHQQVKACGLCSMIGHSSDICLQVQQGVILEVNTIDGFYAKKYDPYSNTYNSGWRDDPNFKWGGQGGKDMRNHNP